MRRLVLITLLVCTSPLLAHNLVDVAMRIEAPAFAVAQQAFTYQVIADDLANDNGFGIVVTIALPSNATYLDANGAGFNCARSGSTLNCSAEQLSPGPHAIAVRVTAPRAPATLVMKAKVTSIGSYDGIATNDNAEHSATVYDPAQCASTAPQLLGPSAVAGAAHLSWTAASGASRYAVFSSVEGEKPLVALVTTETSAILPTTTGRVEWWVEARSDACPSVASSKAHYDVTSPGLFFVVSDFATGFRSPAGIAFAPTGEMYVVDRDDAIVKRIANGAITKVTGSVGVSGAAEGENALFDRPQGIAITPLDGLLYVADTGNHAVRILYPGGPFIPAFTVGGVLASPGKADGEGDKSRMNAPAAVAATERGTLYAADTGNGAIRKLTPVSGYIGFFDVTTVPNATFGEPTGIAVDADDHVFVSDRSDGTVRRLDRSVLASGLRSPGALATDTRGNVYVCDDHSVRRISPTGYVTTLATTLPSPAGLAIGADGTLYVSVTGKVVTIRATEEAPKVPTRRRATR
ncbi:MAG: NHL repeat-containing protein [Acidobacteria bacterium]|nr:NHL repeat-containing protein [Acidobacteriota bacterium]